MASSTQTETQRIRIKLKSYDHKMLDDSLTKIIDTVVVMAARTHHLRLDCVTLSMRVSVFCGWVHFCASSRQRKRSLQPEWRPRNGDLQRHRRKHFLRTGRGGGFHWMADSATTAPPITAGTSANISSSHRPEHSTSSNPNTRLL